MKKTIICTIAALFCIGAAGCTASENAEVVNVFEQTPPELIEEYTLNAKEVTLIKYYEMSDGTWKTDQYAYRYKLVLSGRLSGAAKDITYTFLSNTQDISFEQAWKASGLSSDSNDYFRPEEAVLTATKMG